MEKSSFFTKNLFSSAKPRTSGKSYCFANLAFPQFSSSSVVAQPRAEAESSGNNISTALTLCDSSWTIPEPKNTKEVQAILDSYGEESSTATSELTLFGRSFIIQKPARTIKVEEEDKENISSILTTLDLFPHSLIAKKKSSIDDEGGSTSQIVGKKRKTRDSSSDTSASLSSHGEKMEVYSIPNNLIIAENHQSNERGEEAEGERFTIKKKLTTSDVGDLSRLLLSKRLVDQFIKPFLSDEQIIEVDNGKGTSVTIWDEETLSAHPLIFKKVLSTNSYVFINNWRAEFVRRRELKVGDEIGMYWDCDGSFFHFTILKRA